jgi:hypothetical protein
MKKQIELLALGCISIGCLLIQSCSRDYDECEGKPESEIRFREVVDAEAMKLYPYKGNETLTFISNKGDTAILVGKGQLFKYPKLRFIVNNGCTDLYHEHEILFTEFVGTNPNFNQLRVEVLNTGYQAIIIKPYVNNKTNFGDYWNTSGFGLYSAFRPESSNITFNFKDSVVSARRISLPINSNWTYFPLVIYYKEFGIIGYLPDSNIVYTLQ